MKLHLAMAEKNRGLGGRGATAHTNSRTPRGENAFLLSSGGYLNSSATDSHDAVVIPSPAEDLLLLQEPENFWFDLALDMSNFVELDQIPEVVHEPALSSSKQPGSLILPHLVRDMGLKDEEEEEMDLIQAANMKILDQYRNIMDGDTINDGCIDDSMDSFDSSDLDSNQSLIEEVETYLQAVSGGEPTILTPGIEIETDAAIEDEQKVLLRTVPLGGEEVIRRHEKQVKLTDDDNSRILKAMVEGKVLATADRFEDDGDKSSCSDISFELTEEDLANAYTTTIKTENGQDVIIIIAQPAASPASRYVPDMMLSSPREEEGGMSRFGSPSYASSSDYEWSPSPHQDKQAAQRKKYQRKNRPTFLSEPYPRDKVERKKAQNRTAAFRYREKKKAELDAWDSEIGQLEARNIALKARLRNIQQELSCVKRLMVDTGLGHYLKAGGP